MEQPHADPHAILAAIRERQRAWGELAGAALRERADRLRRQVESGEASPQAMIATFALVAEAARRTVGLDPYDVQLLAGLALYRGEVIEMHTGEGKTLAAVAPVCLRAFEGGGVHVLTFNDYLARRDAEWMGPVYRALGVTAGTIQEGMEPMERRVAYRADLTYATAKEAGFDFLRDGLALDLAEQVHRYPHRGAAEGADPNAPSRCAVVDEADSILIDDARIPLVIAGDVESPQQGLDRLAELARRLRTGVDYDFDEHDRNIFLTEEGSHRVEEILGPEPLGGRPLFAPENGPLLADLRNALHAEELLERDVDYLVRDGRIELVDELTGRVADKRRWPEGLQAALEAKEGLLEQPEGRILGSITLQHYFGLYPHLSGMTGTALPAAEELDTFYDLPVTEIPTHRPSIREDHGDRIYTTREAKLAALAAEIRQVHATGRPILVGTLSVRESEELAARLEAAGVACRVLNAKNDEQEAVVVARAGEPGAVTISTNMAGRGTDIRLGGTDEEARREVLALGGLYVIGTNRHESRRIDDQLRGRAGRQGDPGSSRFFLSLEDPLMVRYGIAKLVPARLLPDDHDGLVDHPVVQREIDRVQRIMEGESFDIRKRLWEYSSRLESQRRVLQEWRQGVLDGSQSLDLLRDERPGHWTELVERLGEAEMEAVERRLTLLIADRCWSEHLAELQVVRDEIHWVAMEGLMPLAEFCRIAGPAFVELQERIDDEIAAAFDDLPVTAEGVDWGAAGLQGPSATWTYLVNDQAPGGNLMHTLAMRPTFFLGAVAVWPVLFAWALFQHLRRWRGKGREAEADAAE